MRAHTTWGPAVAAANVVATNTQNLNDTTFDLPEYLSYEAGATSELDYLQAIVDHLGLDSRSDARLVHEHILDSEVPSVLKIVEDLNRAGVPTACLSNNNPIHWATFTESERFPAVRAIQFRFASFELGFHKPEPEIFKAFCERTGWEPESICYIEDNVANAKAAAQLGWNSFTVDPKLDMEPQLQAIISNVKSPASNL